MALKHLAVLTACLAAAACGERPSPGGSGGLPEPDETPEIQAARAMS